MLAGSKEEWITFCLKNKLKFKFWLLPIYLLIDTNALNAIRKLDPEVPALFIHGGNDTFIPTFMVNDFYRAKRGIKEKWICPGAGHDQSWLFGIAKYRSVVYEFLSHNGLMKR